MSGNGRDRDGDRVRFGVMAPGDGRLDRYQAQVLRRLEEMEGVSPELLILGGSPREQGSRLARVRWRRVLYQAYAWLLLDPEGLKDRVPLPPGYRRLPRISVTPRLEGKYSEHFPEEAVDEIRSHDLDFILRFTFGILRGEVLEAARHGVWSFHHANERRYRGAPPAFWEVYHGNPETGCIFQRLTEELDGGVVLARDSVPTILTSYEQNLARIYRASRELPVEVCRRLRDEGAVGGAPSPTLGPILTFPTNGQFLLFWAKILVRRLRAAAGRLSA